MAGCSASHAQRQKEDKTYFQTSFILNGAENRALPHSKGQ
jgi:hypothetical protein